MMLVFRPQALHVVEVQRRTGNVISFQRAYKVRGGSCDGWGIICSGVYGSTACLLTYAACIDPLRFCVVLTNN